MPKIPDVSRCITKWQSCMARVLCIVQNGTQQELSSLEVSRRARQDRFHNMERSLGLKGYILAGPDFDWGTEN